MSALEFIGCCFFAYCLMPFAHCLVFDPDGPSLLDGNSTFRADLQTAEAPDASPIINNETLSLRGQSLGRTDLRTLMAIFA